MTDAASERGRTLVTGATGFVGAALCGALREHGVTVVPVGHQSAPPGGHAVAEGTEEEWAPLLSGVDAVVHLGARTHVLDEQAADPLAAFRQANVGVTERLARAAIAAKVKRFIFMSTATVYGSGHVLPVSEVIRPAPETPYAVSKLEAEGRLQDVLAGTPTTLLILRPPLVYGPGVKARFLQLMRLVDSGVPLPFASIYNARAYIGLDNLVSAIEVLARSHSLVSGTYLVSDGDDLSTPDLIRKLAHSLGRSNRQFWFPVGLLRLGASLAGRRAEMERLTSSLPLDIGRFCGDFDWTPPVSVEAGLRAAAVWYRKAVKRR